MRSDLNGYTYQWSVKIKGNYQLHLYPIILVALIVFTAHQDQCFHKPLLNSWASTGPAKKCNIYVENKKSKAPHNTVLNAATECTALWGGKNLETQPENQNM